MAAPSKMSNQLQAPRRSKQSRASRSSSALLPLVGISAAAASAGLVLSLASLLLLPSAPSATIQDAFVASPLVRGSLRHASGHLLLPSSSSSLSSSSSSSSSLFESFSSSPFGRDRLRSSVGYGSAATADRHLAEEEELASPASSAVALRSSPSAASTAASSSASSLVWPSPEAEARLAEIDGVKLYPTHNWAPGMRPIVPASHDVGVPLVIGVAADSGCGKTTFLRRILGALGTEVAPGHTAVGDVMTVICLDDYHINDRFGRQVTKLTALDARENDFELMGAQIEALKKGQAVYKPIYNHDTGNKDTPELIEPNEVMVFEGLHPLYDERARSQLDLGIYIDIVNDVKFAWKVKRDVAERGWTEEQVQKDIAKRQPDFSQYVDPQKAYADVILRYEPASSGLPALTVKLIQILDGSFPPVFLKSNFTLPGDSGELRAYDGNWLGRPARIVEMEGFFQEDILEEQLEAIEEQLEGLESHPRGLLVEALLKLRKSPGSDTGTGLMQTIIAMRVKELHEARRASLER